MVADKEKINAENVVARPPVVVILGHVDSGKTSLLDYIRKTKVAEKESGGITQHIGAYQVGVGNSPSSDAADGQRKITFIDTPGHEAFSAMRARGAKVADIAILVIDGEQGVQPQTKEAISHIKSAGIPMIAAINKIDRPEANPEKIKKELMREDVLVESFGGKVPSINVSAKSGQGVIELLELILLVGEMESLKGDLSKSATGVVIESYLDQKRGPVSTLLILDGVLKIGDIVGTISACGKVKNLEDFRGVSVANGFPSDPLLVMGLSQLPRVGEKFEVFSDLDKARGCLKAEEREKVVSVELLEGQNVLNIVLKSDVEGSVEAIYEILKEIPRDRVLLNILKTEAGDVNESDVKFAKSARAVIFGFRVKANPIAKQIAERDKVKIITFDIIYDFVESIRKFMEKIVMIEDVRTDVGKMKVLAVFLDEKNRHIVGGRVFFGEVKKGAFIEVLRNEEVVGKGKMINLQKNKKDAERVARGEECGILYEGDVKIETGDTLVFYIKEQKRGEL